MKRSRNFALGLAAFALLIVSGCGHLATPSEKENSFKPFASTSVGRLSLRDFLESRTAVLVAGATPQAVELRDGEVGVKLRPTSSDGKVDVGSAAALTGDGYFLTANHCIRRSPVFLVAPTPGLAQAYPARVVWESPTEDARWDLAVLKIDGAVVRGFSLAADSDLLPGQAVATTGANGEAAGKLVSVASVPIPDGTALPPVKLLIHDAPLSHGDSGGPLTNLDGKLLGIEVLVRGIYFGPRQGVAIHVDGHWLSQLINQDRASHTVKASRPG